MSKRITVRRLLKKQLSIKRYILGAGERLIDMIDALGGPCDPEREKQNDININKDISELNFLLKCLDNREKIEVEVFKDLN